MTSIQYDTIIVGAGFAGLIAARELGLAGQSVLVLEAADRLGGRAYSSKLGNVPIELGGGYVYWSQPHIWSEITRYGLTLKERPYYAATNAMAGTRFLINGVLQDEFSQEEAAEIKSAFSEFLAPAKDVFPKPYHPFEAVKAKDFDKMSNKDRIDQLDISDLARAALLRTSAMQGNNSPYQGGYIEALRWYALSHFDDATYAASVSRFTLKEGSAYLLDKIAEESLAKKMLNMPVDRVSQEDGTVTVSAQGQEFKASNVIIATGVNVWKSIEFSPKLSNEKQKLTQEELSGKGAKIYVSVKGRFKDSRWSAIGGPILSVLPHIVEEDQSTLVVFTNPEVSMEISKSKLQIEIARFDDSLEVLDFTYHDWVSDPFALGTWGNFRPNQFTRYFAQAVKAEGDIHFATADLAYGWRGFFDGAIESGLRAARNVLES